MNHAINSTNNKHYMCVVYRNIEVWLPNVTDFDSHKIASLIATLSLLLLYLFPGVPDWNHVGEAGLIAFSYSK